MTAVSWWQLSLWLWFFWLQNRFLLFSPSDVPVTTVRRLSLHASRWAFILCSQEAASPAFSQQLFSPVLDPSGEFPLSLFCIALCHLAPKGLVSCPCVLKKVSLKADFHCLPVALFSTTLPAACPLLPFSLFSHQAVPAPQTPGNIEHMFCLCWWRSDGKGQIPGQIQAKFRWMRTDVFIALLLFPWK